MVRSPAPRIRLSVERRLNVTHDDAVALVALSLEALVHRHHCVPDEGLTRMPEGLLGEALAQLDENGFDTAAVRADFVQEGFDLSKIPYCAEIGELNSSAHDEACRAPSTSKVPTVISRRLVKESDCA